MAWYTGARIDNFGAYPDPVGLYAKPDTNFISLAPHTPLTVPPGGAGVVTGVRSQPWGPLEYSVTVKRDSPWNSVATHYALNYVSSPQVQVGQRVQVGDLLAYTGGAYSIGTAFAFTDSDIYGNGDKNAPFQGTYINPALNPVPYLDNIKNGGNGLSNTVDITLKEYVDSVLNQIRNDAGVTNVLGQTYSKNIENFLISWAHHEGGSQTNKCSFNILNTMQDETGAVQCPGTLPGIKAYPDSATGEKATLDALKNGHYSSLLHALANNDEGNLGFYQPASAPFERGSQGPMAANIAGDLSVWVSGKRSPIQQAYILAIMQGAGISGAYIQGGNVNGGSGTPQATIDKWGATVIGQGTVTDNNPLDSLGAAFSNVNSFFGELQSFFSNPIRLVKIVLGALLLITGIVLLIKELVPGPVKQAVSTAKTVATKGAINA